MRWFVSVMVLLAACRGGGAIPPSRLDVAPVTMSTGGEATTGLHVAYGVHWASLSPSHKTDYDVGVGYIYEGFDEAVTPHRSGPRTSDPMTRPLNLHAIYVEGDRRIGFGNNHRAWAGMRLEALLGGVERETRGGIGLTGRLSWELYGTVQDRAAVGAFGIGAFAEVGARKLPDGRTGAQTVVGLTVRLPAAASK